MTLMFRNEDNDYFCFYVLLQFVYEYYFEEGIKHKIDEILYNELFSLWFIFTIFAVCLDSETNNSWELLKCYEHLHAHHLNVNSKIRELHISAKITHREFSQLHSKLTSMTN